MTAPKRRWLQFSLRDLFLAVTFVAVGCCGLIWIMRADYWGLPQIGLASGIWYGSSALVGAGLLAPFRKKAAGAIGCFFMGWLYIVLVERGIL